LTVSDLGSIAQSCLIVHGELDPIIPKAHAEWAHAHLTDAELFLVPGMGHALDPANFEIVVERLISFLSERRTDFPFQALCAQIQEVIKRY
jgi:pimeloyl-ACP methyl ester carboxylesterase